MKRRIKWTHTDAELVQELCERFKEDLSAILRDTNNIRTLIAQMTPADWDAFRVILEGKP
jgi:DNA-directed RNA polymerase subunit F